MRRWWLRRSLEQQSKLIKGPLVGPFNFIHIIDGINAQYHNPIINFKETIYARLATWSSLHITQARCHG